MTVGGANRRAGLVTALTGGAAALVAALSGAPHGTLSALLGAGLVLVFLSAGSIPFVIAGDTTQGRGGIAFMVLGLTYALRLVLALVVLKLSADSVDGTVVGLSVIACATAWTLTVLVLTLRRKHQPTLEL